MGQGERMSKTLFQQIIENNRQAIVRGGATGLIALMCMNAAACDIQQSQGGVVDDTKHNIVTSGQVDTQVSQRPQTSLTPPQHSDTYSNAKEKWGDMWNEDGIITRNYTKEELFQMKNMPVRFLIEQGVLYQDSNGTVRAHGNSDFENNNCIVTRVFVDQNTPENDIYWLVQYKTGEVHEKFSNRGVGVATWMLKYNVDDACYNDLLVHAKDYRGNFLMQQIDEENTPQVLSYSLIDCDLIGALQVFDNKELLTEEGGVNYIANIDYKNVSITVNRSSNSKKGAIKSYTYNIKETSAWDKALIGSDLIKPITEQERSRLTSEDMMITYLTVLGNSLDDFGVNLFTGRPTEEHKASAIQIYDLTDLNFNSTVRESSVDKYYAGQIEYEDVNSYTENHVSSGYSK